MPSSYRVFCRFVALVNLVLSQTTNTAAVTTAVSSPMTTGSTVPPVSQGSLAPQVSVTNVIINNRRDDTRRDRVRYGERRYVHHTMVNSTG